MGRIIASLTISNLEDKEKRFESMRLWTRVFHISYYPLHGEKGLAISKRFEPSNWRPRFRKRKREAYVVRSECK